MHSAQLATILILVNIACSFKGFRDYLFFDTYKFETDAILVYKEHRRLLTSGFLHASWPHLIFNMMTIYYVGNELEAMVGGGRFLLIYFSSLVCGNLLALYIHRHHGNYSAVGASGAACGLVFATLVLFPDLRLHLFFVPYPLPGWLYSLVFIGFTLYGIKTKASNIGHEAHLGGAIVGVLLVIALYPWVVKLNLPTIAIVLIPSFAFLLVVVKRPAFLLLDTTVRKGEVYYDLDEKYNSEKVALQHEIDELLDKISQKGYGSLTAKEKEKLDQYSKNSRW